MADDNHRPCAFRFVNEHPIMVCCPRDSRPPECINHRGSDKGLGKEGADERAGKERSTLSYTNYTKAQRGG